MKVNTAQLATWVERDGWYCERYYADGSRLYSAPKDSKWGGHVTVPAWAVEQFDGYRDGDFEQQRARAAKRA